MSKFSQQGIGKGMIYATWLIILGLLTLFFNQFLDKKYNPNQNISTRYNQDGSREIILKRNSNGHYVTNGTINGKPVVFFLDTGATMVSIPAHLKDYLNLEQGVPLMAQTANGTITTYHTSLDNIAIGAIELHNVRASLNPQMSMNEILLGMSFLKHLEFTQRGDTLILRQYEYK
jgi:aspartyl protease family protein